ncbi:DUF2238 domain-containing protein [Candidatus Woesearchaeota archaeon]|nr:DUF2238 domain-containing protein [Candidatus Woesearchaeota archaeon]
MGVTQKNIFLVTAILIIFIALLGALIHPKGNWTELALLDSIFTLALLGIFYKARKYLRLKTYVITLGCIFLVLHNIGSLGPYGWNLWFLRYDKLLHFFGGFVLYFAFYELLMHSFEHGKHLHKIRILFFAMLCTLGVGALTEIFEYIVGYLYNGPGVGFFFYGVGDFGEWNDSIFDMASNLIGTLIAGIMTYIDRKMSVTTAKRL